MSTISRVRTWNTGETLTAADLNAEFNNILNDYNGGITNANISGSAAIAYSKLNLTGGIVNADISGSAGIAASKISDTALTLTATQTATNKTFTAPTITSPSITGTISGNPTITKPTINGSVGAFTETTDASTITFDFSATNRRTVTLGGNRILAVSGVSVGQTILIRLVQGSPGSHVVTWFSTIKWVSSTVPTLTTTQGKIDVFAFLCTATNQFDGFIVGQNLG